ncbi:MAG: DNA alkylation repair protein [Bacilli bacterium]|jgi:3-methyladenine DNA glycosylase AlkD
MLKITTLDEFEMEFAKLGCKYRTKNVDAFNRRLIKNNIDVSFLKDVILIKPEYHRTYFQVSLAKAAKIEEQLQFIEEHFYLLNDWWHVDQLTQFLRKDLSLDLAVNKAKIYVEHPHPFARRWAYVMLMPNLVKKATAFHQITPLFQDDDEYYVVMAEAWLLSSLAIDHPHKTFTYLQSQPLKYNIVGRAIQKICDSSRITQADKEKFKTIRLLYRKS